MALDANSQRIYKVPELLGGVDINTAELSVGYERGVEGFTNEAIRKKLAKEWESLPEKERQRLRAVRAKRGIKCEICGVVGYYRENCPNKCQQRPPTPDSDASTPPPSPPAADPPTGVGIGVLWGNMGFGHDDQKTSLIGLRFETNKEKKRLKDADDDLETFEFLKDAPEGYNRGLSELTLHQILRRLMRSLERAIGKNVKNLEDTFDSTLLHPPMSKPSENFYPKALEKMKQYREYYANKIANLDRRRKVHMYKGHLRTEGAMDAVLRGGDVSSSLALYKTDPDALQSIHSKLGWKDPLSKYDDLANSDPKMIEKAKEVKKLFEAQAAWGRAQEKDMQFRNDRFEHLLYIIRCEIELEHDREYRMLDVEEKGIKKMTTDLWKERFEAVDRICETINEYGLGSGIEDLDLILFTLRSWRKEKRKIQGNRKARNKLNRQVRREKKDMKNREKHGLVGAPIGLHEMVYYDPEKSAMKPKTARKGRSSVSSSVSFASSGSVDSLDSDYSLSDKSSTKSEDLRNTSAMSGKSIPPKSNKTDDDVPDVIFTAKAADGSGPSPYINDYKFLQKKERSSRELRDSFISRRSMTSSVLEGTTFDSSSLDCSSFDRENTSDGKTMTEIAAHVARKVNAISFASEDSLDSNSVTTASTSDVNKKAAKTVNRWERFTDTQIKYKMTQQESDKIEMNRIKATFKASGFNKSLRSGSNDDHANFMPALIPIPKTFIDDGSDPLKSTVADKIIYKTRLKLVDGLSGYTPQGLLPLYVRNTLIEHNGTTTFGDQPQEVMERDKRYNHHIGRAHAHFSSEGFGPDSFVKPSHKSDMFYSPYRRTPKVDTRKLKRLEDIEKDEKNHAVREERRRRKELGKSMLTGALARIAFSGHKLNEMDYLYKTGMKGEG